MITVKKNSHPWQEAELVRRFQKMPPDVDTIILQHHERPDGTGFPRGLDFRRIAPLSAVFIVAEEFAELIYESGLENDNVLDILDSLEEKYQRGNFKMALGSLKELFPIDAPKAVDQVA